MKSVIRNPQSAIHPWLTRAAATLALACTFAFAAEPSIDPAALDNAFAKLPQIEYGQDGAPLAPFDKAVAAAHGNETLRKDLEKRFIGVLQGKATAAGKDYACRALKVIGTADSVPALAALLPEAALSGLARYALESMPSPAVDPALRDALPKLNGKLKVGVISSLGVRRDRQAVEPLSGLLKDADAAVAGAAALALGKIATPEAARALAGFRAGAPETLRAAGNQAYLEAASNLLRQGERDAAAKIYEELFRQNASGSLHLAGFQGLVAARPNEASTRLVDALSSGNGQMRNLAARLISELPGRETPRFFLEALPKLPADGQAALLNALRARGDASVRPAVLSLLQSQDANVRVAVVETLAAIGNASDVATLARLAATAQGQEKESARKSLANLPGQDVNPAIVAALAKAEAPVRVELLRSLSDRSAGAAAGAVLTYVADADDSVSRAAIEVLGAIANEQQVPALVRQLSATKSEQSVNPSPAPSRPSAAASVKRRPIACWPVCKGATPSAGRRCSACSATPAEPRRWPPRAPPLRTPTPKCAMPPSARWPIGLTLRLRRICCRSSARPAMIHNACWPFAVTSVSAATPKAWPRSN